MILTVWIFQCVCKLLWKYKNISCSGSWEENDTQTFLSGLHLSPFLKFNNLEPFPLRVICTKFNLQSSSLVILEKKSNCEMFFRQINGEVDRQTD